jgi:hypothetical protein
MRTVYAMPKRVKNTYFVQYKAVYTRLVTRKEGSGRLLLADGLSTTLQFPTSAGTLKSKVPCFSSRRVPKPVVACLMKAKARYLCLRPLECESMAPMP